MAEEVTNVKELGSRFKQAVRALATKIVEMQVGYRRAYDANGRAEPPFR